jgi:hypothetical protein
MTKTNFKDIYGRFHATYGGSDVLASETPTMYGEALFRFAHSGLFTRDNQPIISALRARNAHTAGHTYSMARHRVPLFPMTKAEFELALSEAALGLFSSVGAEVERGCLHMFASPDNQGHVALSEVACYDVETPVATLPVIQYPASSTNQPCVSDTVDMPDGIAMSVAVQMEAFIANEVHNYLTMRSGIGFIHEDDVGVHCYWIADQQATLSVGSIGSAPARTLASDHMSQDTALFLLHPTTFESLAALVAVIGNVVRAVFGISIKHAVVWERRVPFSDDTDTCLTIVFENDQWERLYSSCSQKFDTEFDAFVCYIAQRLTAYIVNIGDYIIGSPSNSKAINQFISDFDINALNSLLLDVSAANGFDPCQQADYVIGSFSPRHPG